MFMVYTYMNPDSFVNMHVCVCVYGLGEGEDWLTDYNGTMAKLHQASEMP